MKSNLPQEHKQVNDTNLINTQNLSFSDFLVLTVRDDSELKPPPMARRSRVSPPENTYDRRRYRPLPREYTHHQ